MKQYGTGAALVILAMVLLLTTRCAHAQGEITCEHVKQASLVTGHKDPKHIAAALGLKLTDAQIAAAAHCLRKQQQRD